MTTRSKDDIRGDKSDGINRSDYVWEGPNGTERSTDDYSPNTRLTYNPFEKLKERK